MEHPPGAESRHRHGARLGISCPLVRSRLHAPLPGYDQNIAAAGAATESVPWSAHVEEFRRVRLATVSLFRNMPPEAWTRSGIAGDSPFTVRALAFIIAGHLAHHAAILRQRYLPGS
jgi:hypothetical protein